MSSRSPDPSFSWKTVVSVDRWRAGAGAASLPSWRACADPCGNSRISPAIRVSLRVLQHGRAAEYDVIGDLAELGRRKVDAPGRAEKASVIERSIDGVHSEKPAQPVAGIFHLGLVNEMNGHI